MVKKLRKSKEDWLKTALDILETEGIDAVHIERMAAILHTSKSGFY